MKPSIAKTKAKNALTELRAAYKELGSIRPSIAMSREEFIELCKLRGDLNEILSSLEKLLKGGES